MRLIDADLLYKAMQDAEELARKRVRDTESTLPYPTNLNPAYTRYLAQMDERIKAKKMVADAPTVDAVPVVHGRWIQVSQDRANCNRCNCESGKMIKQGERYFPKFCPECGADMRKDGEAHGTK